MRPRYFPAHPYFQVSHTFVSFHHIPTRLTHLLLQLLKIRFVPVSSLNIPIFRTRRRKNTASPPLELSRRDFRYVPSVAHAALTASLRGV